MSEQVTADIRAKAAHPRVGAGLSTLDHGPSAAREALDQALAGLRGADPDLVFVFASPQFDAEHQALLELVDDRVGGAVLLGCSAGGVIGGGTEVEDAPAVSVWAASLPGADLRPFHLRFEREGDHGYIEGLDGMPKSGSAMLLLSDPYSFPADLFLAHLNDAAPGVPVIGGQASGGLEAGRNALFFENDVLREGAVGVVLSGVPATWLVSQGCRPVGRTFAVTRAERNVIFELGGAPAMKRIEELYAAADQRDQLLIRRGLHVGQVASELNADPGRGDFLIRNVVGVDQSSGAIAITDVAEVGQTVQFQVRDADSAREDLRLLLERERERDERWVVGALLFSCNGRGQALFGQPDHDVGAVRRAFGGVPVAGFFAAGELGPVGQRNFVHGFTASMLLIREGSPPS